MYQEHFKLKRQPFSEHAAVSALWIDQRMKEALTRLTFLVDHAALGLVTGPSGVGKSALLKCFLDKLPQRCEAVYCHLTHLPSSGLLKVLVGQMGEVPRRGKDRLFEQIYQAAKRVEGTLLLVIDEAHLLDGDALTDLRLLISSALDVAPLKILLVGQHALRRPEAISARRPAQPDQCAIPTAALHQGADGTLSRHSDETGGWTGGRVRPLGEGPDS